MANTILVGAQWGDEGKGKIIDVLTEEADIVVARLSPGADEHGPPFGSGGPADLFDRHEAANRSVLRAFSERLP